MICSLAIIYIRLFRASEETKIPKKYMRRSDIMGDCIAKKDSWPIAGPLAIGPLAVTQPPKVLADGFSAHLPPMQPLSSQCPSFPGASSGGLLVQRKSHNCLLGSVSGILRTMEGGGLYPGAAHLRQTKPRLTSERERKYTTQILHLSPLCPEYRDQVA